MNEPRDTTHLGLNWPEAYADVLPVLQREWDVEERIFLSRSLGGGKSGALVFFVDISTKDFAGQAILKLDQAVNPSGQQQHEAELHERAMNDAPGFAAKHLPRLLHCSRRKNHIALLSTIAGRGLEYVEPWIECSYGSQLRSIKKVSNDLLETWNADYHLSSGMHLPQELLRSWLGYRLVPAEGGRIHKLLYQECAIPIGTSTIMVEGNWYPNPLAFVEEIATIPKRLRLRGARGHCHCDFHGLNLLVSRLGEGNLDYFLIDLAMYESEQYLFFDHAYFELAYLLFSRGNAAAADWQAVVTQLARFQRRDELPGLRTDDIGLLEMVRAIRQGATKWIERHEGDRLSFMEGQMLLARVAAGLSFSHKNMSLKSRQMAFFYAACNLKDYLKLNEVKWRKTGVDFVIGANSAPLRGGQAATEGALAHPPVELNNPTVKQPKSAQHPDGQSKAITGSRQKFALAGLAALITVVIAFSLFPEVLSPKDGWKKSSTADSLQKTGDQAATSLAVMPFKSLNADGDDTFAFGLTIEIASVFGRTGAFRMPSISSTFRFKDRLDDFSEIGKALNADYLVEGTVLSSGNDLKITANLIRVSDGLIVWSGIFDDKMNDIFDTQEKIAEAIGSALSTPLSIDADILKAQRSDNPHAYELFVRGLALLEQRGRALVDAMAVLERAVEIHPDFAAAWGALSLVYNVIPSFVEQIDGRPTNPVIYYRKAKEAALRAQRIDSDLPIVRHALAYMYQRERLWIAAENEYEAALLKDSSDHRVMLDYAGLLYTVGKRKEALEVAARARELDRLNELYNLWVAFLRWQGDQTEANIEIVEEIFRRSPQYREIALRMIIDHRARSGELDKARDLIDGCIQCSGVLRTQALTMLDDALRESPVDLFEQYKDANILGYQLLYSIGGPEVTLEAFHYYGIEAKRRLIFFTVPWPLVDALTPFEQFTEIAEDMGLVTYWRDRGWPDGCKPIDGSRLNCQ